MGRRAKKAPVQTKKRAILAKRFKCPFCANDETVECKMDFRAGIGSLVCRLCAASYQMPIHHLNEPVDVFSEWLDDCEAAAQGRPTTGTTSGGGMGGAAQYESDEEDEQVPEASGLSGKSNGKPKEKASGAPQGKGSGGETTKATATATAARPSYNELGLDDSDDDDDDDDDSD